MEDPNSPNRRYASVRSMESTKRYRVQTLYGGGLRRRQNPLFFKENTQMLFGDAKERVDDILTALNK